MSRPIIMIQSCCDRTVALLDLLAKVADIELTTNAFEVGDIVQVNGAEHKVLKVSDESRTFVEPVIVASGLKTRKGKGEKARRRSEWRNFQKKA